MNKLNYSLIILLNELQTYESMHIGKGQEGEANVASSSKKFHKGSTSGTKFASSFAKKKWKKKKG